MSSRMLNEHGLTQKQELFAQAIAEGLTQAEAHRRAYPVALKWKAETVHETASRIASNPKVSARITAIQSAGAEKVILKIEDVLEETRRVMLSTPAGVIDKETGKVKLPHELDAATAAAVSSFSIDDLGRVKYTFWDKNSSLERAAKILGAFERDNKQKAAPVTQLLLSLSGNVFRPAAELPGFDDEDDRG